MAQTQFKKGDKSCAGPGRPKGLQNKATKDAREAIAMLVDRNVPRMEKWLDEIAQNDGPVAAWRCLQDVIEYHVPKLSRQEHTGAGGGPIVVTATTQDSDL